MALRKLDGHTMKLILMIKRSETFVPLLHLVKVIIVKIFVSPLVLIAHVMMDTMERDARKIPVPSCRWLKEHYPAAKSGNYRIKHDRLTVFCDMETFGGGWTTIGRVITDGSSSDNKLTGEKISGGVADLYKVSTNRFLLSSSGFKELRNIINFTQFRFYCHKSGPNRTIHIVTANNASGYEVLNYLDGDTDTRPG